MTSDLSAQEQELHRLAALARYAVVGTLPEATFDRLTLLAAQFFGAPIALISLIDEDTQYFKSCLGVDLRSIDRSLSFCAYTLQASEPLIVPDMTLDPRFAHHPMVTDAPHVRFYAGAPLETPDGYRLGTLCIIDDQPRSPFTVQDREALQSLAVLAMDELELRLRTLELEREAQANRQLVQTLKEHQTYSQGLLSMSQLLSLDLPPMEVTLRALELISEVVRVDWGSLVAVRGHKAQVVTSWFRNAEGEAFGTLVPNISERGNEHIWQVVDHDEPAYVNDYRTFSQASPQLIAAGLRSAAWLPLGHYDETRYVVIFTRLNQAEGWRTADRDLLTAAGRAINAALAERNRHRLLEQAAFTDALTGLGNRRALELTFTGVVDPHHLKVALLDLDGFKAVNDLEGHDRGDVLLKLFSSALVADLPPQVSVYRLGGDEFVVLNVDAQSVTGDEWRDDMLAAIDAAVGVVRMANFSAVGASVGVALGTERIELNGLLALADERMYLDKRGRRARPRQHSNA
ncbi:sensor domain-containing diguanylate cyclase [Deinococcus humi]|uniref:Diguanylate cyclase (GGDEF)-like protein n=1 Tax=Deinococcus humi TaxID=662880 RepID=A0A7W8JZI4_9DEIO|nr:sensor domain-containing diguanylate cyclase [Deinococcus humi]MBB5365860.1 diguanylate cyclase (GGDEF)-like protein [Deinococcus humi]GGO38910.1 diguanylate cyclase [Deinococcus humi]